MPSLPMDDETRFGGGGGGGGSLGGGNLIMILRNLLGSGLSPEEIEAMIGSSGMGQGNSLTPFNLSAFTPVAGGGGSRESQEARMFALASSIAQMEAGQRNALFSAMFPAILPFLQDGGEGFSPEALAAMNSQAIEGTAGQFGNARSALATELARRGLRGGGAPISGEGLRRTAELGGGEARATSEALRDVLLKNDQQRISNLFNSANLASGFQANPSAAINAASGIPEPRPGLGSTLASSLLGSAASAAGRALGTALSRIPIFRPPTGGTTPTFPCAVAKVLYGENDLRVYVLQLWLVYAVEPGSRMGRYLVNLYRRRGMRWAEVVQHNRYAYLFAKSLFDRLVVQAIEWLYARQ